MGLFWGLWYGVWEWGGQSVQPYPAAARAPHTCGIASRPLRHCPPSPSQVLQREVARFEADHLEAEPDARWPLLMVARLKEAQARLGLAPQVCVRARV
jgi:hypothetical protein